VIPIGLSGPRRRRGHETASPMVAKTMGDWIRSEQLQKATSMSDPNPARPDRQDLVGQTRLLFDRASPEGPDHTYREVKAAIKALRNATRCFDCGGQPIEWHAEHHNVNPRQRISTMVRDGCGLNEVMAEINRCEPLCRRCHMKADGRLEKFAKVISGARGRKTPSTICMNCGQLCKPPRKGRCSRCYDHLRNHGSELQCRGEMTVPGGLPHRQAMEAAS
jgi:hypothetical protein